MLKSIFSLLDYPKPRKLIMDINIYNTLDFLNTILLNVSLYFN